MLLSNEFLLLAWNPSRTAFSIPYLNHPVAWYGLLFAVGFIVAYLIGVRIYLFEAFRLYPLTEKDLGDKAQIIRLMRKYPKKFKEPKLDTIVTDLNKYIQLKKLPFAFFKVSLMRTCEPLMKVADRLTTTIVIGLIVGARLGYVFFYGLPAFLEHPLEVFKIWEGGLASHGACLGILVALFFYSKRAHKEIIRFTSWHILDILAVICGALAFFIRLGNFVNQEIVGLPTSMPWGVVFLDPLGGELGGISRHPVQLYEAIVYLFLAVTTFWLWKTRRVVLGEGKMTGILLCVLFSFRFFVEFTKMPQGMLIYPDFPLQMGQILSLPFIALGLWLIFKRQPIAQKAA